MYWILIIILVLACFLISFYISKKSNDGKIKNILFYIALITFCVFNLSFININKINAVVYIKMAMFGIALGIGCETYKTDKLKKETKEKQGRHDL